MMMQVKVEWEHLNVIYLYNTQIFTLNTLVFFPKYLGDW